MKGNCRNFSGKLQDRSNEELVEIFQCTQDEECLKELMVKNQGLIHLIVRGYKITGHDYEDLIEIGNIELWKVAGNFDSSRGVAFTTCLKTYIKQALNRLYNEANRLKRGKGDVPLSHEELTEINKEKAMEDDYSSLYLDDFLNTLSDTTHKVAQLLIEGLTNGEIAQALGFKPATITYHTQRIGKLYTAYSGGI